MAFIMVVAFLDIMSMGIASPVLPHLIEEFIGSNSQAGLINGMFIGLWALMQGIASPVIGSLSDRFGRRPVILVSTAGLAIDFVIMALAPNLWWLALGRAITGITSASFTTVNAYIADVTPVEKRSRAYGLLGAIFSCGIVAGPLLGGVLGEVSPRAPFWAAAVLSALTFLYGIFLLPESLTPERRMPFSRHRANPMGSLRLLRSSKELSGLSLLTFLSYFSGLAFATVFVLYASYRYQWQTWHVGVLFAAVGVLNMIVQGVLVGPITQRIGDRGALLLGLAVSAVGMVGMGLASSGLWFVLALVPLAFGGLATPALQSLMTRQVSESEQGQLQGANMSIISAAGLLSPLFFGMVYSITTSADSNYGPFPGAAFLIASVFEMMAAVGAWIVARQSAKRTEAAASAR